MSSLGDIETLQESTEGSLRGSSMNVPLPHAMRSYALYWTQDTYTDDYKGIHMTILQPLTESDVRHTDHKDKLLTLFNAWVADGEQRMTILKEDGVYRHLQFRKPGSSFYHFELITFPGYLVITGDMGSYTFSRVHDMFEFFSSNGYINSGYWAEKVVSGSTGGRGEVQHHDEEAFKSWVVNDFWETSRNMDFDETCEWWNELRNTVLSPWGEMDTTDENECINALLNMEDAPDHHYDYVYENPWRLYDWHFEMCLAGILTGIRTYNGTKTEGN